MVQYHHVETGMGGAVPPCDLLLPLTLSLTDPIEENYIRNKSWKRIVLNLEF